MEYICRRLSINDIDAVMDMNKNYRAEFICYDNAYQFLKNTNNWLFAAIRDKIIIGFAYGYELDRLNNIGNMVYLHEVGVMEQYQRQGIGYRMMSELIDLCREKKICRIFLSTDQNNVGANALYRKLGGECSFESSGNDRNYFFQIR